MKTELMEVLEKGAKKGVIPSNVACPIGCKFCYERSMKSIFPRLEFNFIPRYNRESFTYFYNQALKYGKCVQPGRMAELKNGKVYFGKDSDFFETGLSKKEIEKIIEINKEKKAKPFYFYTTGRSLDPEFVRYLTEKYDNYFRIWLSVITFNEKIKRKIITNWTKSEKILEIIKSLKKSKIALIHFNFRQTIKDIETINNLNIKNISICIMMLHYNKFHPSFIKNLAENSYYDFKEIIEYIKENKDRFKNVNIRFLGPPECYAWKNKDLLKKVFKNIQLTKRDIILCSKGSYKVMKNVFEKEVEVSYIPDSFGGSTNFSTAITSKDVIKKVLKIIISKKNIRRIFLPSSIWWIKDKYDYEAKSAKYVKKKFPGIKFNIIKIPKEIINSSLSVEDCYRFYKEIEL